MKTKLQLILVTLGLAALSAAAQVPGIISHQGKVTVNGTNWTGSGAFKFAVVNAAGTTTYWSNDGTGTGGAEPNAAANDRPRRLNPIKQKQMEERCAFLEEETPRIEAAIAHTEEQLGVYVSAVETQRLSELAEDLRSQLTALTAEWEELMLQLEGA
jgi:chromosome segregation ATPase